jgi:hypothetical protein
MLRGEDDEENPPEPLRIRPPVPIGGSNQFETPYQNFAESPGTNNNSV